MVTSASKFCASCVQWNDSYCTAFLSIFGLFCILALAIMLLFPEVGLHLGRRLVARAYAAATSHALREQARKVHGAAYAQADQGITDQFRELRDPAPQEAPQ